MTRTRRGTQPLPPGFWTEQWKASNSPVDGKVYTAPELRDVAHHSDFTEDGDANQVNAFIQKTFDTAGLTADEICLEPNTVEAAELTALLSSVTAGIYFTQIAQLKSARDSLIASLWLSPTH